MDDNALLVKLSTSNMKAYTMFVDYELTKLLDRSIKYYENNPMPFIVYNIDDVTKSLNKVYAMYQKEFSVKIISIKYTHWIWGDIEESFAINNLNKWSISYDALPQRPEVCIILRPASQNKYLYVMTYKPNKTLYTGYIEADNTYLAEIELLTKCIHMFGDSITLYTLGKRLGHIILNNNRCIVYKLIDENSDEVVYTVARDYLRGNVTRGWTLI